VVTPLDDDLDELFTLPPAQFTRARNTLSDRLRQGGRKDQAAEVKRLPRPSATVWAINRTAREAPKAVAEMVDAVAHLEQAQAARSPDLREAIARERRARGRVLQLALARLAEGGHPSAETVRRLSATLLGAAGDRSARADLTRGRLREDRQATGFDLLAATPIHRAADRRPRDDGVPAPRRTPAKVATLPVRAVVEDGRRRREEERRAREAARRAEAQARARDRRAAALERQAVRHRRLAQKAEQEATALRAKLRRVEQKGADAASAASKAAEGARRARDEP
jgi:hypothetical protein